MRDHTGDEWIPAATAAIRSDVETVTVRAWVRRGKVRGHRIGRVLWVNAADVADAELKTRGRYARQRRTQMQHCAPGSTMPTPP